MGMVFVKVCKIFLIIYHFDGHKSMALGGGAYFKRPKRSSGLVMFFVVLLS